MKFFTPILIISCLIAIAAGFSITGLATALGTSKASLLMNTAAQTAKNVTSSLGALPKLPFNITMPTPLNLPLLKMMKEQFTKFQNQIAAGQATVSKMIKAAAGLGVNSTAV